MSIVRLTCQNIRTVERDTEQRVESPERERKCLLTAEFFACRARSRVSAARYVAALAGDRVDDLITSGDAAALDAARLSTLARLLRLP